MSDSDDDLLALADVGSKSEDNVSEPSTAEIVNPYPLEGKYRDAADRAQLDAMPEIEREGILYERAQEMQRYEERQYLAQRRRQMTRLATDDDDEVPAPKRQRGTTGVTSGTKSSLETLKSRRMQQSKRSSQQRRRGADDESASDYSASEDAESDDDRSKHYPYSDESDLDSEDEQIRRSFRRNGRRSTAAEWADSEDEREASEAAKLADQTITLSDVNKIRWGKTLFAKFCLTPGFTDAVPGCFVRVNVGTNRDGYPVYRLCQVRKVVPHKRYAVLGQTVDEAVVASVAGSERTLQFGICSDSPCTQQEFEFWVNAMNEAGISLPSRRRAQLIFNGVRALSKRALTSEEIDEMVKRRAQLNGQRGANAVLAKAELLHQREIAIDQGDAALVQEIDEKLSLRGHSAHKSGSTGSEGTPATDDATRDRLYRVNERNKRANVESVRRAEVQANSERRKAGTTANSDPFSRLRTTARVFYSSEARTGADQSAAKAAAEIKESANAAKQLQNADTSMPLGAVDDLIARIDIELDIDI